MAWKSVDFPTFARPTYHSFHDQSQFMRELTRLRVLRTIPLFKLFPGLPKSTFFSSSFFLGGILLLPRLKDVEKAFGALRIWKVAKVQFAFALYGNTNADPAAQSRICPAVEVKMYGKREEIVVLRAVRERAVAPLVFANERKRIEAMVVIRNVNLVFSAHTILK